MSVDDWAVTLADRWPTASGPGWLLVNGDCLDVLAAMPAKSCAVVLTDPPYEAEAHTEQRRQLGADRATGIDGTRDASTGIVYRGVNKSPLAFSAITADDRAAVAARIARIAAHRASVFCQAEAIGEWKRDLNAGGMPYRRSIPWIKPDAMPSLHGRWPGQGFESIVLAQHPSAPPCPVGGKSRVYTFVRAQAADGVSKNPHPTTKPLPLMLALVDDFTDPGDLVLDPYCGSATTGIACLMRGRTFVGIEKDPDFFAVAVRRMRGESARPQEHQPSLFATGGR